MQRDQIEFSFLGMRGRAHGRFGIVVLAVIAIAIIVVFGSRIWL